MDNPDQYDLKCSQGRRGGYVTLHVNDQLESMELCLGMDDEPAQSLWARIKRRAEVTL